MPHDISGLIAWSRRLAGDPIGGYDFGWMRQELGAEALRR